MITQHRRIYGTYTNIFKYIRLEDDSNGSWWINRNTRRIARFPSWLGRFIWKLASKW